MKRLSGTSGTRPTRSLSRPRRSPRATLLPRILAQCISASYTISVTCIGYLSLRRPAMKHTIVLGLVGLMSIGAAAHAQDSFWYRHSVPGISTPSAAESEENQSPVVSGAPRSEEHTAELQSLMRTSYAVFSLKNN